MGYSRKTPLNLLAERVFGLFELWMVKHLTLVLSSLLRSPYYAALLQIHWLLLLSSCASPSPWNSARHIQKWDSTPLQTQIFEYGANTNCAPSGPTAKAALNNHLCFLGDGWMFTFIYVESCVCVCVPLDVVQLIYIVLWVKRIVQKSPYTIFIDRYIYITPSLLSDWANWSELDTYFEHIFRRFNYRFTCFNRNQYIY